jgi:hypothetical protein
MRGASAGHSDRPSRNASVWIIATQPMSIAIQASRTSATESDRVSSLTSAISQPVTGGQNTSWWPCSSAVATWK